LLLLRFGARREQHLGTRQQPRYASATAVLCECLVVVQYL